MARKPVTDGTDENQAPDGSSATAPTAEAPTPPIGLTQDVPSDAPVIDPNAPPSVPDVPPPDVPDAPPDVPPSASDDGLVAVTLVRPCKLTHPDGTSQTFPIGNQRVPLEVAGHWYFRYHTDDPPPELPPRAGTPQFVEAERHRRQADDVLARALEAVPEEDRERVREILRQRVMAGQL